MPFMTPVPATLLPSRQLDQVRRARDTYLSIADDNLLHGFRKNAGKPAPGNGMGGWCSENSGVIFGQVVSGLARIGKQFDDADATKKAIRLFEGWRETAGADGEARMGTYAWDKLMCGLVDLHDYAGYDDALKYAAATTRWASGPFDRSRTPASAIDWDGRAPKGALEWYTLGENLYRAYLRTNDAAFREFADVWRYDAFWNKFADTNRPATAHSVHAYSHVNSLCSLAASYEVSGDERLLQTLVNAGDYVLNTQCYATGGYGPWERLLPIDGQLGRALDLCFDHAEVGCGSWAVFKLATYLLRFTREVRWADWIERVLHNLIGAALPVQADGRTFYYADYRPSGALKLYYDAHWPCCSGTYLQAVSAYHELIAFRDADPEETLRVAVYLPSEVCCPMKEGTATLRITPNDVDESVTIELAPHVPPTFRLLLRVPGWVRQATATLPDGSTKTSAGGTWLDVGNSWRGGEKLTLALPTQVDVLPVDPQHPTRGAIVRGPLVFAQNGRYARPLQFESVEDLRSRLKPHRDGDRQWFDVEERTKTDLGFGSLRPYYQFVENAPYRLYHDFRTPFLY